MSVMDGSGTTGNNRTAGGGLAEVGALLKRRREEIGQDLVTIAKTTHIRQNYLKAIEEGRRRDLPGTAYMIGYVRTYADYLGFDGNRLVTDYHAQLAGPRRKVETAEEPEATAAPVPKLHATPTIAVGAMLLVAIAVYMGWSAFIKDKPADETVQVESTETPEQPSAEQTAEAPAEATEPAPETGAEVVPGGAEASTGGEVPADQANNLDATTPAAVPDTTAAPDATTGDQVPPEADSASASDDVTEESPAQPEATEADAKGGKIVVRARLESWIQVTNPKKEVVFSRVLRVGETYTVPTEEKGLLLTTGNAGGVDILVDGRKMKTPGAVGLVKRDIPLDPKKLKDGSAFKAQKAAPGTQ